MPALIVDNARPVRTKAPFVVGPTTQKATRPTVDIPQTLIDEAHATTPAKWDVKKHLAYRELPAVHTMKEIGLEGQGISNTAVSDPFPLFTEEAMMQMRREFFSQEVLDNCRYSSDFNANMIRGMGQKRAPFTYSAWWDPVTLAKISEVAGVDLVPAFDFEVANVNISINDANSKVADDVGKDTSVAWHYDSFPFVCVTMASDCADMVGGETAISLPNGEIRKVRGPAMGTAVVLQGRYINHRALKAFGGRERIAVVTAFRPKSPFVRDESLLTGVRAISDIEELYSQYTDYRLEVLEERFRAQLKEEKQRQVAVRPYDLGNMREFLMDQKEYIEAMLEDLQEVK